MIFLTGIHGVGKSTYAKSLAKDLGIEHYSASQLIKKHIPSDTYKDKQVNSILSNQLILLSEIDKLNDVTNNYILDGHMCLLDERRNIVEIPEYILNQMKMYKIITITADPASTRKRLLARDNINWDEQFIERFQDSELAYAQYIATKYNILFENIKEESFH